MWTRLIPTILMFFPATENVPISKLQHRPFSEEKTHQMKDLAKDMFYFGYNNYIEHAFPLDELNPIYCNGRGHDWNNP